MSAFRAEFDRGTARPAERCPMPPDRSTHRPADRKDDYQEFLGLFSGSHSRLQAYIRSLVPDAAHAEASDLHYDNRRLPVTTVAVLRNDGSQANAAATPLAADRDIRPSTLESAAGDMRLTSTDGADVRLETSSRFGFSSGDPGVLFSGSVRARGDDPGKTFSAVSNNLRIVDVGTEFRVSRLDSDRFAMTVLDGDVEVQPRVRLPVCYWPFDDHDNTEPCTIDSVQGLSAALGSLFCGNI